MPGWISRGIKSTTSSAFHSVDPSKDLEAALQKLKIKHFDRDILTQMTLPEIREHFGYPNPNPAIIDKPAAFKIQALLKNVIWQTYEHIRAGQIPEFVKRQGNIRGLWYYIKTRFHRHKPLRGKFYKTMIKMLARMVEAGVLSYSDFRFRDLDQRLWWVGPENPHVIVFCEKDSFASYTEEYVTTYGCSALTMGGAPSLMSVDYFTRRLVEAGVGLTKQFILISIVDFDPRGEDGANDFITKLELFGIRNFHRFTQYESSAYKRLDLIQPKHFSFDETDPEGDGLAYTLPSSEVRSKLGRSWFRRTGGVHGNPRLGLESDECTGERIHQLLIEHLVPLLEMDLAAIQHRTQIRRLRRSLSNVLIFKQTGVLPDDTIHQDAPPLHNQHND